MGARLWGGKYSSLNKICKSFTKKTLKEYIDSALILEIKRMLINMNLNISEIAFELGFDEVTNFSKYFKRRVGQTPNDFRKSLFAKH